MPVISVRHLRPVLAAALVALATAACTSATATSPSSSSTTATATAATEPPPPATPRPFGRLACVPRDGVRFCQGGQESGKDLRVPSFDGVPLDADVTLPASGKGPFPLVVMLHGLGGSKSDFESTSDDGRIDNVTFASKGYAVLNYTARGFGDSCGTTASRAGTPACAKGWIRLADQRYEVRDTQYLAGMLVDEGLVRPGIAVTGVSYGGGQTLELATLKDRIRLPSGRLVAWTSPVHHVPMSIAAAYAVWPWFNLASSLVPNGNTSTSSYAAPASYLSPVGVAKQSWDQLLYGATTAFYLAPPGADPQADLTAWEHDLMAGEPYGAAEASALDQLQTYHSAIGIPLPSGGMPPVALQNGWNDTLFPVSEAMQFLNRLHAAHEPGETLAIFDDVGHGWAKNLASDVAYNNAQGTDFLDAVMLEHTAPSQGVVSIGWSCPQSAPSGPRLVGPQPTKATVSVTDNGPQTVTSVGGSPAVAAALNPRVLERPALRSAHRRPRSRDGPVLPVVGLGRRGARRPGLDLGPPPRRRELPRARRPGLGRGAGRYEAVRGDRDPAPVGEPARRDLDDGRRGRDGPLRDLADDVPRSRRATRSSWSSSGAARRGSGRRTGPSRSRCPRSRSASRRGPERLHEVLDLPRGLWSNGLNRTAAQPGWTGGRSMSVTEGAVPAGEAMDADTAKLHALGYAQELRRRMSGFSNFAVSFTIISILSGCLTLFGYGMETGGPVDMVWGWIFVGLMTTIVGLGMAEISSSYPTAGGLYYWSAKLAKRNGAAWSWFTGWFNLLGQVAVTAGIDFGFALFFTAFLNLTTGWSATQHSHVIYVYAGILIIHGLLNTRGVRVVAFLSNVSVWWHVLGVLVIAIALLFLARPPRLGQLRVHQVRQPDRLQLGVVRLPDRPADGAVHLHRLRRLGAHVRGDARRRRRRRPRAS